MPQITLVCPICQKHFESYSSENRKYCCHHCSRIALKTREFITCPICKTPFIPMAISGGGKTKTCSSKCGGILRRQGTPSPETLFWENVSRATPDDCWLWKAAIVGGYGVFNVERKIVKAHRFSYQLHKGPIPEGMVVMHSCDNPPCVNPSHLSVGTNLENIQDCVNKGRRNYYHAVPSYEVAQEIRKLREVTKLSQAKIGELYHLSQTTIGCILRNERWVNH